MQRVGNFVAAPGCVQFRVVEMRAGICNVRALSGDDIRSGIRDARHPAPTRGARRESDVTTRIE